MDVLFLVEDESALRHFFGEVFSPQYEVLMAVSFPEAMEKIQQLKERNCRVAMVDGSLGHHKGDGKDIAERLRNEIPGIRIVACSAEEQDWGDINLLKPAPIADLLEAVRG
ncbi:MAG: response regulator [bacterium]|nr:response regulator [bacterium]